MMGNSMENGEQLEQEKTKFEELIEKVSGADIDAVDFLNASNNKAAQDEFVANDELLKPNNEYGNLDLEQVSKNIRTLSEISDEISGSWVTGKEERLLNVLAENCRLKNEFVFSNYAYNHAETPEDKEVAANWHRRTNEALYGRPDENTFYGLINETLTSIHPETPEEEADFSRLKEMIGDVPETEVERFKPKQETVERFSEIVQDFFADFLKYIPDGQESFTSDEMVSIINQILENEFGGDVEYKAIVTPKNTNASVNHDNRLVKFPPDTTYTRTRAKTLLCHELGTHVMRAVPYLDSQVEAFSKNFPQSESFEEGVAKCVEQAIKGEYEDSGVEHYINIGLANIKGKNFREVYDIQMLISKLTHTKPGPIINRTQRCFRGTGELPNNKDLAYYNGAEQAWRYIEEHIDDPELMDNLFLAGKTTMMDKDQERLVYEAKTGAF